MYMDNYKLKIIKDIKELTYRIYKIYQILSKLEQEDKKDSDEYQKYINILNINLLEENNLYNNLGNNPIELSFLLEELTFVGLIWDVDLDFTLLIQNHEKDLVERRIILKICDKINNIPIVSPISPLINRGILKQYGLNHKYTNLSVTVRKDFINTFLYFLNNYINDTVDNELKKKLINFKYSISLIYEFIEDDFIIHNFNINPNIYWLSPLCASINRVNEKHINEYQKEYALNIRRPIYDLCEMNKKDLSNLNSLFNSVVDELLIRTSALFGKEEYIKEINDYLNKTFLKFMGSCNFIIKDSLKKYESDKEIPIEVNLKLMH